MRTLKIILPFLCLVGISANLFAATNQISPLAPTVTVTPEPPVATPSRPHPLVWDAMEKTYKAKIGETNAHFAFTVTNNSKVQVLISDVKPSCGCTVADFSQIRSLAPGASGEVKATMNLMGKTGTQVKLLTVHSTGGVAQSLTMMVEIPVDTDGDRRKANMAIAARDRQAVFKTDCASCHVEPLKGKTGEQLFVAGCNICHAPEGGHRAEIVPDLHKLTAVTDKAYWKKMISDGKEGSLMPGFAKVHGGPLTDPEIDSLVEYALKAFPFNPENVKKTN